MSILSNMQHKTTRIARPLGLVILAAALAGGAAAEPKALGRFKDWAVFTEERGGDLICYAATEASSKAPSSVKHGEVWYYVTSWKSGQARNQPSFRVTYDLKASNAPKTTVGRSSWQMFVSGREGFADDADDPRIVDALKKGSSLTVTAQSARGTNVTYRFSLSGSADAIAKAEEACR
ncbi:MAG: hypothetical protein C0456_15605 [Hyphomonas sp.]|nr:hypothetical protein [Hyphomonas sp.]